MYTSTNKAHLEIQAAEDTHLDITNSQSSIINAIVIYIYYHGHLYILSRTELAQKFALDASYDTGSYSSPYHKLILTYHKCHSHAHITDS